jgi:uncharacterized protein (TIGR03067 family)
MICVLLSVLALQPTGIRDIWHDYADTAEKARILGEWKAVAISWGGARLDVKNVQFSHWTFEAGRYKAVGKEDRELGKWSIDHRKSPKHLDLTPTEGEERTTSKCIYSLNGDELKIVVTAYFAPGTPEEELRRLKEMKRTRPVRFEPRDPNLIRGNELEDAFIVLTLKRVRNE